ncbi:MAG TPA: NAD(P)-binding domain-containing protein [Chitinophagales bacterium]|nr:NAD(P)-binding domain-containing protein [Chitinophagales bacterium]
MSQIKVCVIGGGSSGITTAKVLNEAGIDFDCYEKGSKIGGNWLFNNDNGQSSSYQSLHINTSKQLMAFSDYPMPDDYPDYPHHSLIYQYFENYIDYFGFRNKIHFNTTVLKIERIHSLKYIVHTNQFEPKEYTHVIVANGHHWKPKYPNFDGEFSGSISHSHDYKSYHGFENKKVLIVGIGNSAVDIACELSTFSRDIVISTRSGAYIIPKYLFGRPTDHISKPPLSYAPLFIQQIAFKLALKLNIGNQSNYGVPVPDRPLLNEHPTISQELLNKVGHGKVKIKPNILKLDQNIVHFTDGTQQEFDHIIFSTGYEVAFPFFNKDFVKLENNAINLYEYVVHPEYEDLFFVGLIQPLGAIMPLAELQAKWISKILKKEVLLPHKEKMNLSISKRRKTMIKRYGHSSRHTFQVDFFPYKKRLKELIHNQ